MKFLALGTLCVGAAVVGISVLGGISLALEKDSTPNLLKTVQVGTAHDALFGLSFDQGKGVAVGMAGSILESSDGGVVWKALEKSPTSSALLAVDRHGDHTIAVGQQGAILVEEGPGKWTSVQGPTPSRLFAVSVNAAGVAVAAGEFGTIIRSADGGHTWTSIAPESWDKMVDDVPGGQAQPHIYAANVTDAGEITVAGEFGLIIRSKDEGKNWQVLRKGQNLAPSLFSVYTTPKGNIFAVGQKGDIERSTDGGKSWTNIPIGLDANLLSVASKPDGQQLIITGMRAMLRSTDGGATWAAVIEDDTLSDWYQAVRTDSASGRIEAVGHAGKIIQIGG